MNHSLVSRGGRSQLTILITLFLHLIFHHVAIAEELAAVTIDRENSLRNYIGVIRSESPNLVFHDLASGEELTFKSSQVKRIRKDIGDDNAARAVGIAPVLAWKLVPSLPEAAKSGKVATVDGRSVYVTLGANTGLKKDDRLIVYRKGKPITNPDTGEVLGQERKKVGELLVSSVEDKYSKTLFATDIEVELKAGDLVEPASAKNALAIFPLVDQRAIVTKGGVQIAEELTGALVQRDVTVVERIRLLDAIKELNLQQSSSFDEKTVQTVGNHLGAFGILTGSITHSPNNSKVNIRVIEVGTGKVLFAQTFNVGKLDTTPAILLRETSGNTSPALPDDKSGLMESPSNAGYCMTKLPGGEYGNYFSEFRPKDEYMVGIEVTTGKYGAGYKYRAIASLRGIYQNADGVEKRGQLMGQERSGVLTLRGKKGYCVSALETRTGGRLNSIRIQFSKLNEGTLDKEDSYWSEWANKREGPESKIVDSNGVPIRGLHGRWIKEMRQVGLVIICP